LNGIPAFRVRERNVMKIAIVYRIPAVASEVATDVA